MKRHILTTILFSALITTSCSINYHKGSYKEGSTIGTPEDIGGFWEGHPSIMPSYYLGFTFVQSRGQLLGTCFQGEGKRIALYYLENCTIKTNHFEGRKVYPPAEVRDSIEGTFEGDSCRLIVYFTEGKAEVILHRVKKLSKTPSVFRDPLQ